MIHPLTYIPDPRLRAVCSPVTTFDAALQTLIDDMFETMHANEGIGLAANQIGITKAIAVLDVSPEGTEPYVIINPKIVEREGEALMDPAGCLSIPGCRDRVPRALKVVVEALDRHGKPQRIEAEGLFAHCLQHEIDHLNGKLYIDYLTPFKRDRIRKQALKNIRDAERG